MFGKKRKKPFLGQDDDRAIGIIMHGELRYFLHSLGALEAIRIHYPKAKIIAFTEEKYTEILKDCPHIDEIWNDPKAQIYDLKSIWAVFKQFKKHNLAAVFDLSCTRRSKWYFKLCGPLKPKWNAPVYGCSHPYLNPARRIMHVRNFFQEMLREVGIQRIANTHVNWLKTSNIEHFKLPKKYAIFVAEGNYIASQERWHILGYAELAEWLNQNGITPVFVGIKKDERYANRIISQIKIGSTINLTGKTDLAELMTITSNARIAIGNDSGAMHLAALADCPSLMLISGNARPELNAPQVDTLNLLEERDLNHLDAKEVILFAKEILGLDTQPKPAKPSTTAKTTKEQIVEHA